MDYIRVKKGRDTMRVRPRGLDTLLAQGWELVGAEKPEVSKPQATPIDAGVIKVRAPRKRS